MEKKLTLLIEDRYRLDQKIGEGGFGLVYLGTDIISKDQVAIKLEHIRHGYGKLSSEADAYKTLVGGTGIPDMLWYGGTCDYDTLVLELLGPSLEDLFKYCEKRFSLKTVLLLVDQLITRLEYVHSKGLVHRDVKPENLLMGNGRRGNTIYAVDFGLAKDYRVTNNFRRHEGTAQFASINFHNGINHDRRDDLKSLGYTLLYFLRGSLPWDSFKIAKGDKNMERIKKMKLNLFTNEDCKGLPVEFRKFIEYSRSLEPDTEPNYRYLRGLFRDLSKRYGIQYDNVFDWTVKKYLGDHSEL